jgi:hypothetical protein
MRLIKKIAIIILSVLAIGVLGLSQAYSNAFSIFSLSISLFGLGYYANISSEKNKLVGFLTFGAGVLFYAIVSLLIHPHQWYLPTIVGPIFYTLGFTWRKRAWLLVAFFSAIYAFLVFPFFYCIQTDAKSNEIKTRFHDNDFQFFLNKEKYQSISFKNQIVLLETWNETCSNCLEAMTDLHPILKHMENETFKHYYLFIDFRQRDSLLISHPEGVNEYLQKKADLISRREIVKKVGHVPIVIEPNHHFLPTFNLPKSLPQFILILPDGEVKWVISGYQSKYAYMYRWYLKWLLKSEQKKVI